MFVISKKIFAKEIISQDDWIYIELLVFGFTVLEGPKLVVKLCSHVIVS